jgi:hypothetical protein
VTLSNPTGSTISTATATGTITNDDPLPSASIADVSVVEGSSGTTPADFTVTLSNPSDSTVTVDWATSDGTATAGSDYTAGSGTVTFNPGETSKPVSVDVLGDTTFELDETFTVTLSNPTKSTIGTATATGTITNDDAKAATTLTIKVSKTRRTVSASGVLELATPLATVKVTISRKRSGHWVTLASKTVGVKNLGDRDGDGIPDASYKASFPRPKRGSYRLRATFAGNATLLPSSSKALTIKI